MSASVSVAMAMAPEVQLACFALCADSYALDIMRIKEIVPMQRIRPVPQSPRYVQGVINLRGTVLPVMDLRVRFGLALDEQAQATRRIIITSISGRIVGLVVDAVTEILKLGSEDLVRVPSLINRRETAYVHAIALATDRIILVLNIDRILSSEESIDIERVRKRAMESAGVSGPAAGRAAKRPKAPGSSSPPAPGVPEGADEAEAAQALLGEKRPAPRQAASPAQGAGPEPAAPVAAKPAPGKRVPGEAGRADEGLSVARALARRRRGKSKKPRRSGKKGLARKKRAKKSS